MTVKRPVYEPALFADADPNLLSPMRLSIDPDTGHVFGFIATWKDSHRSVGLGHITPPRSASKYEHFHTSPGVHLTTGAVLPVGRLTIGIGHAATRGISPVAAAAHYDNVEACWALGRISEHRLGIYFSGIVAPWASPEKVQMGLASLVSGDWRPIGPGGNLELVAVLGVNTPGFLCKVETDGTGAPLAMVASMGPATVDSGEPVALSLDDIRAVMAEVLAENAAQTALTARVDAVSARALAAVGEPPRPPTATERMADLITQRDYGAEFVFDGVEFVRRVQNFEYWGVPKGTPIRAGMKPRGKGKPRTPQGHDQTKAGARPQAAKGSSPKV